MFTCTCMQIKLNKLKINILSVNDSFFRKINRQSSKISNLNEKLKKKAINKIKIVRNNKK